MRRDQLTHLAELWGWTAYDTGPKSVTFGLQDQACIHVRFTEAGGVHNGIYVIVSEGRDDKYVYYTDRNKAGTIGGLLVEHGAEQTT